MKKIAVITRNEKNCGIYGYTQTMMRVLETSTNYQYKLYPCDLKLHGLESQVYIDWLNSIDADAFLYNWCPITMPWLTLYVLQSVQKPHFIVSGHDAIWFEINDPVPIHERVIPAHVWSVDPYWMGLVITEDNLLAAKVTSDSDILYEANNYSALPRPVPFYSDLKYSPPNKDVIKIGTFGLSGKTKNYEKIVERVCHDFPDQQVHLTLRATKGKWIEKDGSEHDNSEGNKYAEYAKTLATPNVHVEITYDFIYDQHELATWLNSLDLIVFVYDPAWLRTAVSSSIDHALAARKPIAINLSKMFSHVLRPDILIEKNSLKDILDRGITPLLPLYEEFSYTNFLHAIESKLAKFV